MAEVGTYYITIMPEMSQFTGKVNAALGAVGKQGGENYNGGFLQSVKNSAIGVALGTLAVRAGDALVSGISTGIDRADTLKNFPRVMEAMGYSADVAQAGIEKIMERMRGLPASTQDVVRLTQAIADSTGDLNLATDGAIAFTDAMIANGSSAAEVTQAQGVLNRILGKQNATAAQWNSLMSVMPIQLNAVAREMLGAGASSEQLREKLNNGEISWNDFLRAVVKLDNEGSGAMKSFHDQAIANSDGIGVAIANLQWRIGTGWANIINAIGRENISGLIGSISDAFEGGMGAIANAIKYLHDRIAETKISENLERLGKIIGQFFQDLWGDGGPEILKAVADAFVWLIDHALQWLVDNADFVKAALGGIVGAITALIGLDIGAKLAALPAAISAITTALAANPFIAIAAAIAAVVLALYTFFTQTETGKAIVAGFMEFIDRLAGAFSGFADSVGRDWSFLMERVRQEHESFTAFTQGIQQRLDQAWTIIGNMAQKYLGPMAQTFQTNLAQMQADITNWSAHSTVAVEEAFARFAQSAQDAWSNIQLGSQNAWPLIRTTVELAVKQLTQNATTALNTFKTNVSNIFSGIQSAISGAIGAVSNAFQTFQSNVSNLASGIANAINKVASSISNLFSVKLPGVGTALSGLVGSGRGYSYSSGYSYRPQWFAHGGVFEHAQIIGIGEAGREAALPLNDTTYREIAKGIDKFSGGSPTVITGNNFYVREEADIHRIADDLNRLVDRERRARRS